MSKKELVAKDEYVAKVAEKLSSTKKDAREAVDAVWSVAKDILGETNKKFVIEGFATFTSETVPAHTRMNNLTGKEISVAEKIKRKAKFSTK